MLSTLDLDYIFEDQTGQIAETIFSDMNERRFLHVRTTLSRKDHVVVQIYDLGTVKPSRTPTIDYHQMSRAVLTLRFSGSYGTVKYDGWAEPVDMENYLRKHTLSFSSSRSVTMSDGQEYKWSNDPKLGHSWTCLTPNRYVAATYDRKRSGDPSYPDISGNVFYVSRTFTHLTVELATSLIIMRNIEARR